MAVLLILFAGSGAAALIYEIVWFQLLELVIGSSAVSIGVLLGTFMGGMCLGSLLLPRLISNRRSPLRVYACLEFSIAVCGVLLLFLMPLVGRVYITWGGYGLGGFLVRGIVAAVCLLPPTLAMGATLPAVARSVEATPDGVSRLGFFYAGNIIGAVFGSLVAGFYLLRVHDMAFATCTAVALNVAVAVLALVRAPTMASAPAPERAPALLTPDRVVYVAIALSGFCALAAEVVWTRNLALLFGASVYTFSIILAVFLVGLGLGSSAGALLARIVSRPKTTFGWCQLLLVAAIAWTAHKLNVSFPYWPINPSLAANAWLNFELDLIRALWAVLPAAVLWGASFPLALASVAHTTRDAGRLVGGVYAANTIGAVAGALAASLLLVWSIGSQHTQQVLMGVSALAGLLLWFRTTAIRRQAAGLGLVVILIATVPPVPDEFIANGRFTATLLGLSGDVIYAGEGLNSSVAVSRLQNGVLTYHNAGKIQASSQPEDMRLQRMLGHLTTLVPKNPRSVLVIGCGAGVTAGAVSLNPNVERVTIAEIEPLVPRVVSKYFGKQNYDVVSNPKVRIRIDDARHYLLTSHEKFDAITSDPLDPWVKGAATLYTKEFFETARQHLNPGGVVTVFVQLYESTPEAVKSEIATFFEVFPNGIIAGNTFHGIGYDTVLLGQVERTHVDIDDMDARLRRPEYARVAESLREVKLMTAVDLFGTYAGRASDLTPYLRDAAINTDRNLRLQYLAGIGLNMNESDRVYADILKYRRFPEDVFSGSELLMGELRRRIEGGPR